MRIAGRGERGHAVVAGDPPEGGAGEQVAGVVVEPGADLDLPSVRQAPVGEVGLPDLVGQQGLEAPPRAARTFVRLGHDETRGVEDTSDGRCRGDGQALPFEVPGDPDRARVEAVAGELDAQGDDPGTADIGRPVRSRMGPPRARLESVKPAVPVPAEQALQMPAAHPGLGRGGGDGLLR